MEQQWGVSDSTLEISAGMVPSPSRQAAHATPDGTLAGTVFTIMALLLGYVGVGFARLLF